MNLAKLSKHEITRFLPKWKSGELMRSATCSRSL